MKRKFLAALLALVMVFSMIPVSASAAGDGEYDIVRLIELFPEQVLRRTELFLFNDFLSITKTVNC